MRRRQIAFEATYCQHVDGSDTIYVTLPARTLPMYQPLLDIGSVTGTSFLIIPVVDLLQRATQTLTETGYDRTDYSNPQPGTPLPPPTLNPIQTAGDRVKGVPLGIHNALTPGLQPLPGSDPNSNVVVTDHQTVTNRGNHQPGRHCHIVEHQSAGAAQYDRQAEPGHRVLGRNDVG
jgi:hypothetical protein